MVDDEIVKVVIQYIEEAIKRNRRIETVLIVILGSIAFAGIALMVVGAIQRNALIALPGSISGLAIAFPVQYLIKLRRENIGLEVIPQLLRLADTASVKKLVFQLIEKLIKQIGP